MLTCEIGFLNQEILMSDIDCIIGPIHRASLQQGLLQFIFIGSV